MFREMVLAAANLLEQNKENLDALNVFPVPDGDTGTNMSLTMLSAAKQVNELNTNKVGEVVHRLISRGVERRQGKFRRYFVPTISGIRHCHRKRQGIHRT